MNKRISYLLFSIWYRCFSPIETTDDDYETDYDGIWLEELSSGTADMYR